jgi:hypothetical protein
MTNNINATIKTYDVIMLFALLFLSLLENKTGFYILIAFLLITETYNLSVMSGYMPSEYVL